jgi:hypothetical protein
VLERLFDQVLLAESSSLTTTVENVPRAEQAEDDFMRRGLRDLELRRGLVIKRQPAAQRVRGRLSIGPNA